MSGSLITRTIVAAALVAVMLGSVNFGLLVAHRQERHDSEAAERAARVALVGRGIRQAFGEAEESSRGFALTGETFYLARWREAVPRLKRNLIELRSLVRGENQVERATTLERLVTEYLDSWSKPLVAAARTDRRAAPVDTPEFYARGMPVYEELARLDEQARALAEHRSESARRRSAWTTFLTASGLALLVALLGGLAAYLVAVVGRPARRLSEASQAVTSGELGARVPEDAPGELGMLGRSFNAMAVKLEHAMDGFRGRADASSRLASIVRSSNDAIVSVGADGIVRDWNPAAERMFGYGPEEIVGRPMAMLYPRELVPEAAEIVFRLRTGERIQDFETTRVRKDGEIVEVSLSLSPITDASGRIDGWSAIARDIGERRRADRALRTGEERFRGVVEAAPDALLIADGEGRIVLVNERAEELFGYAREELVGRPVALLLPESRRGALAEHWSGYVARPTTRPMRSGLELAARRKDGSEVEIEISLSPLATEMGQHVTAIVRDVSERRRHERERAHLAAIVESSNDAIIGLTPDGIITSWNAGAEEQYGYSFEEVLGKPLALLVPPDRPDEVAEILERVQEGERVGHFETVRERRDGNLIDVSVTVSPVLAPDGTVVGAALVSRDVTSQKRLEEERHQALRMEKVGHIAASVAHDFNNLLTVINGFSAMLSNDLGTESPSRHFAAEIARAGKRAAALVQQLLAYSGKQLLRPEVVAVNDVIGEISDLIRAVVGESARVEFALAPDSGHVDVDPIQLEQAVLNLVANARDASSSGGVIRIETARLRDGAVERDQLDLGTGPYSTVAVVDAGAGMDAETKEHAFDPFFTTKPIGKGTGLGLASVKGFVKQSGAQLALWSEQGEGTRVTVFLPQVNARPEIRVDPDLDRSGAVQSGPAGGGRILVVEDDDGVRILTSLALAESGYEVLEASSGKDALGLLSAIDLPVDLVVTDVMMPGMTGPELAEALRADGRELPVLFISGYSGEALLQREVLRPDSRLLPKPFLREDLLAAVREILDSDGAPAAPVHVGVGGVL